MTNEEKARAYDEALKDMRVIYPNLRGDAKLAVEHAFPDLAESEDEEIRKYIVKFVELEKGVNLPPDDADRMLAYLEKQKPATFYVPDGADLSHPRNKLAFMLGQYRKQGHINEEEYWQMLKYLIEKEQKPVQNPKKGCPTYPLSVVGDLLAKTPQEPIRFEQERPKMNIPSAGSGAMGTTPPKFKLDVKQDLPVGLEKEIKEYLEKLGGGHGGFVDDLTDDDLTGFAHHFYELGINARKED